MSAQTFSGQDLPKECKVMQTSWMFGLTTMSQFTESGCTVPLDSLEDLGTTTHLRWVTRKGA